MSVPVRAVLRGMRWPAALQLAVALHGCATVVVPTQVYFPSLKPGPEQVRMLDLRPGEAREYREQGRGLSFKFLGDDSIEPSPVALVASRIAEALPEARRARAIELRRLDVGFLVTPRPLWPASTNTSVSASSGTPAAAIAAGLLLGYAMISTFGHARTDERGVAYIEVGIGAESLRTAQTVPIAGNVGAVAAVETALASALDDLESQARALGRGEQSVP